MLAADYSFARPDPHALYEAGYRVVMRYLAAPSNPKHVTRDEIDRLHAAGLMVGFIGQHPRLDRPRSGYAGGLADGREFNAWADELGVPRDLPIIYTVDVGDPDGPGGRPSFPLDSDLPAIREHFRGLLDAGGRPAGQYGPYWILEACTNIRGGDGRSISCWWQTAGASGSGQGTGGSIRTGDGSVRRLSSLACMFQHVSMVPPQFIANGQAQIDHNAVLLEPVTWAWNPNTQPKPPEEDDDMLVIYWSRPGSDWVRRVAELDNTISQGFAVEGRLMTYIGERARVGHEGWDARTDAIRRTMRLRGVEEGHGEADVDDDVLGGLCLLPAAIPAQGADVDEAALAQQLVGPLGDLLRSEGDAAGIEGHKIDDLIERLTTAGQALARAPQG